MFSYLSLCPTSCKMGMEWLNSALNSAFICFFFPSSSCNLTRSIEKQGETSLYCFQDRLTTDLWIIFTTWKAIN